MQGTAMGAHPGDLNMALSWACRNSAGASSGCGAGNARRALMQNKFRKTLRDSDNIITSPDSVSLILEAHQPPLGNRQSLLRFLLMNLFSDERASGHALQSVLFQTGKSLAVTGRESARSLFSSITSPHTFLPLSTHSIFLQTPFSL